MCVGACAPGRRPPREARSPWCSRSERGLELLVHLRQGGLQVAHRVGAGNSDLARDLVDRLAQLHLERSPGREERRWVGLECGVVERGPVPLLELGILVKGRQNHWLLFAELEVLVLHLRADSYL